MFFMSNDSRAIYNPIQKDTAIFIKTMKETGGAYSLIEVIVAPGGGVGLHYHKSYTETFECLEGELNVQLGKEVRILKPGDAPATVERNVLHRFFNSTNIPCRFTVIISPGSRGFEESLQIAYGLARDGKTSSKGTPTKIDHLGILLALSESKLPGWQGLLEKGLLWIGKKAEKKGVAADLRRTYVTI
jgi:quercetin dioxygenase-like cupin family protein